MSVRRSSLPPVEPVSESRLARGKRIRQQVLGPAKPGTASQRADALLAPLHELGLEFAWGSIWAREGLPVNTRRFLAIALLAAQNRPRELAMHFRAALANGCTAEELREVCLHVTCYCGFPTAADAMRILGDTVKDIEAGAAQSGTTKKSVRVRAKGR